MVEDSKIIASALKYGVRNHLQHVCKQLSKSMASQCLSYGHTSFLLLSFDLNFFGTSFISRNLKIFVSKCIFFFKSYFELMTRMQNA